MSLFHNLSDRNIGKLSKPICAGNTICQYRKKFTIEKCGDKRDFIRRLFPDGFICPNCHKQFLNFRDWLWHVRMDEDIWPVEIARLLNTSSANISRWAKKYGIPRPGHRAWRKYTLDESFFDRIDTEEKAYWLGFITADGCVTRNSYLQIGLNIRDIDHLHKFLHALKSTHPVHKREYESRLSARIDIRSDRLVNALGTLGIFPRKSLTVKPCDAIPDSLLIPYWRGIFDGDGCLSITRPKHRNIEVSLISLAGSKSIIDGFSDFIVSNTDIVNPGYIGPRGKIFYVQWQSLGQTQKIARLLYHGADIFLDRKYAMYQRLCNMRLQVRDWSSLSAQTLEAHHELHGTWTAVAEALNTSPSRISMMKRQLGITLEKGQDWQQIGSERINELHNMLGTWVAVAEELGTSDLCIYQARRRMGMIGNPDID